MIYSRDLLFGSLAWWVWTTFCNTVQRNRVLDMLFQRYILFLKMIQTAQHISMLLFSACLDFLGNTCAWFQQLSTFCCTTDAVLMSTSMQSLKYIIFELKSTTGPQQKPQVNKENDVWGTESAGSKVNLAACLSLG